MSKITPVSIAQPPVVPVATRTAAPRRRRGRAAERAALAALAAEAGLAREAAMPALVVGIDEVGRGPLAGPVVAAAVILDPAHPVEGLGDSKTLSRKRREALYPLIMARARVGIGEASVREIDRLNILKASLLAMRRAWAALDIGAAPPELALVDGDHSPELPIPTVPVVGGDGRSSAIGAASIVAKVTRDRIMAELDLIHPGYGWAHNAGYGTAEHLAALERLGATHHHRVTFAPVARLVRSADDGLPAVSEPLVLAGEVAAE
jgi:ribonuclease HII